MQERRKKDIPTSHERRGSPNGTPVPRKTALPGGMTHPCTSEVEYADDEREFITAMQQYKERQRRAFPTWREVLLVLKSLGYRQVARNTLKEVLNGTAGDGGTVEG